MEATEKVTVEMLGVKKLVPMLKTMEIPIVIRKISADIRDFEVNS